MLKTGTAARRALPSVDRLLNSREIEPLLARYGRPLVIDAVRTLLDEQRAALGDAGPEAPVFAQDRFIAVCAERLAAAVQSSLRPVFNLTGTVLHTNLGRALLPECAADAVRMAMTRAVNLEYDLEGGARGERDHHIERRLTRLTGAEAAIVVNNNAAAVYLALNTLGLKREVLVSRGELIEIGGAFRIPDIMARAGCKLREVGTTNRTHLKDYAEAVSPRTATIMKVHTSNYAIHGFTASAAERDLAELAHEHHLPFIVDLGSGTLVDLAQFGLPHEPTPREALDQGADLVTFSGDKLLGGPQAGLIVGRAELISRLRKNPLKRALRVDKMTLAALEAVLQLHADPERLARELPTMRSLTRTREDIEAQVARVLPALQRALGDRAQVQAISCMSQIGSGSLPVDTLPSSGIAVTSGNRRKGSAAEKIAAAFRRLTTPVIGRIKDQAFVMDLRCLDDESGFVSQIGQLKLQERL